MDDQIVLAVATALATKGAEALGVGARSAIGSLFSLVRGRFGSGTRESAVLDAAITHPQERWRHAALASALADVMARDPNFAAALDDEWRRLARTGVVAVQGQVVNHFSGTAGKVVQARDIQGDINF
ncbi:hypothetical protein O7602_25770 [Micromonospora sp. WMMD1128]|uniref:hypothetical protein n=1 Tax=unclassified Micromonospora TaxID=2617518 RepID=UPI00248C582A|nr:MULTISPECIES: hypothetical protein [unclassified Micromonospora]WBB73062.1 hypothetical protein O7602_25770 [Micromonospora sp. WMMD1128]WFE33486.1 hypothetical protein O7613_28870 [Micromonospora sp. WMMD975]